MHLPSDLSAMLRAVHNFDQNQSFLIDQQIMSGETLQTDFIFTQENVLLFTTLIDCSPGIAAKLSLFCFDKYKYTHVVLYKLFFIHFCRKK